MTESAKIKVVDWKFDESGRIQIDQIAHMQQKDMPILGEDDEVHMSILRTTREIPQVLPEEQGR